MLIQIQSWTPDYSCLLVPKVRAHFNTSARTHPLGQHSNAMVIRSDETTRPLFTCRLRADRSVLQARVKNYVTSYIPGIAQRAGGDSKGRRGIAIEGKSSVVPTAAAAAQCPEGNIDSDARLPRLRVYSAALAPGGARSPAAGRRPHALYTWMYAVYICTPIYTWAITCVSLIDFYSGSVLALCHREFVFFIL